MYLRVHVCMHIQGGPCSRLLVMNTEVIYCSNCRHLLSMICNNLLALSITNFRARYLIKRGNAFLLLSVQIFKHTANSRLEGSC